MIKEVYCVKNTEVENPSRRVRISTYASMNPHNLEPGDMGKCLDFKCPLLKTCNQKGVFNTVGDNDHRFAELEFFPENPEDK